MISDRQIKLLNAIITEYIKTAEPVGSVEVVKKYNLKYSPATARNEMAKLLDLGFLDMLHTSSGRIPTPMAYRLFLDQIMEEEELPVLQEVAMKQRLWPHRFEFEKLLRRSVVTLSENIQEAALATTSDGYITTAGLVNILDHKEFWDIDVARTGLNLIDRYELLEEIFHKAPYTRDVRTVIGVEIGIENMENCALVFSPFQAGNKSGHVAVFGPSRMRYDTVIPAIRYTKNLIQELGESW
jgi:transcriptional regulator of heat shock response